MKQRGFSLLELVVATAVAAVVLLLIAQLVIAGARVSQREGRALDGRDLDAALRALRHDLHAASVVSPPYGPLGDAPMSVFVEGGVIEWQIVGKRLERRARIDGREMVSRFLPGVQRLRWEQTWRRTQATEIQPAGGNWVRLEVAFRARNQRSF